MDFKGTWVTEAGYQAIVGNKLDTERIYWIGSVLVNDKRVPTYWDEEGLSTNAEFHLKERIRPACVQ